MTDLSNLSDNSLQHLIDSLKQELEQRRQTEKAQKLEQYSQIAQKYGMTLDELLGKTPASKPKAKRLSPKPKPSHLSAPLTEQETAWRGKNPKPNWLKKVAVSKD